MRTTNLPSARKSITQITPIFQIASVVSVLECLKDQRHACGVWKVHEILLLEFSEFNFGFNFDSLLHRHTPARSYLITYVSPALGSIQLRRCKALRSRLLSIPTREENHATF